MSEPKTFSEAVGAFQRAMYDAGVCMGLIPERPSLFAYAAQLLRTPFGWLWLVFVGMAVRDIIYRLTGV